jgi:hypothetical protein
MSTTVITKPKVEIAPDLLAKLRTQTEEAGQVILHFLHYNWSFYPSKIRIWPSSYLFDIHSDHRSELVHAENITWYPEWMDVPPMGVDFFTLIFSGLPKSCTVFDFEEHCHNQAGAFVVRNIARNESDVYYLRLG